MATIKDYTDIAQSKKLAEILPLESANMRYDEYTSHIDGTPKVGYKEGITEGIPCWSLTALLSVLPNYQLQTQDDGIGILCSCKGNFNIVTADNPVDACVALIEKLHELNLL